MQRCFTKLKYSIQKRKDLYWLHRNSSAPKAVPIADPPPPLPLRIASRGSPERACPCFFVFPGHGNTGYEIRVWGGAMPCVLDACLLRIPRRTRLAMGGGALRRRRG